ncbi:enoyl-CoA hydratase/isomerase family protein, partial [Vibrio parahaemolyticus 3256]
HSE